MIAGDFHFVWPARQPQLLELRLGLRPRCKSGFADHLLHANLFVRNRVNEAPAKDGDQQIHGPHQLALRRRSVNVFDGAMKVLTMRAPSRAARVRGWRAKWAGAERQPSVPPC